MLLHGYLLEQDDQETAGQLGISRATVRALRFRGLKRPRGDAHFMAEVEAWTGAEPAWIGAPGGACGY